MKTKTPFGETIRRNFFDTYRRTETKLHELKSILWECTLRCNLNCGHCGSDCRAVANTPDADKNLFFRALEDIRNVYNPHRLMVGITGGEPLMRKDLPEIISHISAMGFPVGMVSNGFALTPEKFTELLNSGLNTLTVSLDGPEAVHNELRKNPLSYRHAFTALKNAAVFSDKVQGKVNFNYDVITCVHPGNIDSLSDFRNTLVNAGIRNWRIFAIFPSGRAANNRFDLSPSQFRQILDFIKSEREKKEINVSYSCEGWLGKYEGKVRQSYYFCRAGITNAGIFADGRVGGCISIRSEDFIAGNLNEKPFMEIWENGFDLYRNRLWTKKGNCAVCSSWKHCMGNGLHLYPSINSEPTRCSLKLADPEAFS